MTWTHDKPMVSGCYWIRYARQDGTFSAHNIAFFDDEDDTVIPMGDFKARPVDRHMQFYSTPIAPPEC